MAAAVMLVGAIDAGAGNFFFGFLLGRGAVELPGHCGGTRRFGAAGRDLRSELSPPIFIPWRGGCGSDRRRDGGRGDAGGAIDAGAGNFFFGFLLGRGAVELPGHCGGAAPGVSVRRVGSRRELFSEFLSLGAGAAGLTGARDGGRGDAGGCDRRWRRQFLFRVFAWGAAPSSYRVIAAAPGVSVRRVGISVGLSLEFLSLGAGAAGLTGARDGGRGDAGGCDRRWRRQFLFRVFAWGAAPSSYRVIAAAPGVSVRRVGISVGLSSNFYPLARGLRV